MAVKNIIDNVLKAPMTRKEFLGQMGGLLLAVIGVTSVLHALSGDQTANSHSTKGGSHGPAPISGYGDSPYGGSAEGA